MSEPNFEVDSPIGIQVVKPRTSIYTVMLIVALIALMIGCLLLYLEISKYGGMGSISGPKVQMTQPIDMQASLGSATLV